MWSMRVTTISSASHRLLLKIGTKGDWLILTSQVRQYECVVVPLTSEVITKIISGVPDKMSGRPSALCRTFWAPVGHFLQLMTGKYQWSFLLSLNRTFYVYWSLPGKMSGKVCAFCRTSAKVCRTCPVCPAYFVITASSGHWYDITCHGFCLLQDLKKKMNK